MKARRFLNLMIVSLVAMAYTSCSSSDDVIDTPDPIVKTYTMTVDAQKGSNGTRALSLDGSTLNSTWTKDDAVEVYKGEDHIGTLTAQSTGANTSLKGTLSGDLNVNDNLTLKYLSADYNSQDGTLTGTAKSIDKVCDYSTATVKVTSIAGGNISTENANFENQQAVVKFTLKNADGASLGNPTAFSVTDGTSTVTLSDIPDETYTTNGGTGVLYVAFPASGASATISLEATVGSDTYAFEKTGITFTNSKYYGVTVKMTKQGGASEGALSGQFSVSATKKVYFSKGNLQYDANAATKWYFAEHQYDYIGSATGYPMDLFTWGNIANPTYNGTTYYKENSNLSGDTDWGYVMGEGWRTLSQAEWNYLFKTRSNATAKYGYATVNEKHGIIILPDVFTDPNKNNGSNAFAGSTTTGWDANVYTSANWAYMEAAGAVFLPAAGNRYGTWVEGVGSWGRYWSSTGDDTGSAYDVFFDGGTVGPASYNNRSDGFSVRLVRDVVAP